MQTICANCGSKCEKSLGHYNRAMKLGLNVYCNRTCFGLAKRKSIEEKKATKAAYDKKIYTTPERKQKRHEYFVKSYAANPEKYKAIRKAKYPKHLEYLRRPEYKEYKKEYDQKYRAAKLYGEFSEAALVLAELEKFLDSKKIKYSQGITQNKSSQKRQRKWKRLQQKT